MMVYKSFEMTSVPRTFLCFAGAADEVDAEGMDSKERSCVMIQTQYYLSNLSSSYNILQDCGNCSRSVSCEQTHTHTVHYTHLLAHVHHKESRCDRGTVSKTDSSFYWS